MTERFVQTCGRATFLPWLWAARKSSRQKRAGLSTLSSAEMTWAQLATRYTRHCPENRQ